MASADFQHIPADVQQFILSYINSIEQIEILLLLAEEKSPWSADELADKICTTADSVVNRLGSLKSAGVLAQVEGTYVYQPRTPELDATVTKLSQEYRQRRISIINFVYSQPIQNIRTISDAFRIRPPDKRD